MLDLGAPTRHVEGVELAADDRDPQRFHALPPAPRVAFYDGVPALQLLRFVADSKLTGGHLRMQTLVAHQPGTLERVAETLSAEHGAPVSVGPVPVTATTAELLFVGREPTAQGGLSDVLARPFAAESALVQAPHIASFAVPLTAEAVGLVEAALRSAGAPLAVTQRLRVEGVWPAQRVIARVDWSRVYDHMSEALKSGRLLTVTDIERVTERLVEERAVVIDAVQTLVPEPGEPPPDLAAALAFVQREIVERFCEPVMELSREPAKASLGTAGEILGVGTSFAAKRLTQIERATAELDLSASRIVSRTYTVQSHLADLLSGVDPQGLIVDAHPDHPFFRRFDIRVRAAAPLADLHLAHVLVDVDYGTVKLPMRLAPEAPEATGDCWADASPGGTWTLSARATFTPEAPVDAGAEVVLDPISGSGREVTLDLEEMLRLTPLRLSATLDERVLMTSARVTHRRGAELISDRELQLAPGAPEVTAWLRDRRPADRVEAFATHLLQDQRIVAAPPVVADSRIVRLPPPFPGRMTVQLYAGDDWDGVSRIVVALQKTGSEATGTVTLTAAGSVAAVALDLPDPADRRYRYRATRISAAGVEQEDPWVETDRPAVLLGGVSGDRMVVELTPIGPEPASAGIRLIEVALSYIDAEHQLRDQQTKHIQALADRPRWEFAIADPARRTYEYRITVHRTTGAKTVGPWTRSSDRILPIPITAE